MSDKESRGEWRHASIPGDAGDPRGFVVAILDYCESLLARHYSVRSVESHERHLAVLAGWLLERSVTRPSEVTRPMLQRFQRWLFWYRKRDGRPLSIGMQADRIDVARSFFRYLARENRILYNPASDLDRIRRNKQLPRFVFTPSEVERVLQQPDLASPLGLRDRAILETFYATGVRRFELAALTLDGLNAEHGTLMIRLGKGRKDRMVPISERAVRWIEKYVHEARPLYAIEPDPGVIFLGVDGSAIGLHQLTKLGHQYVAAAGLGKGGSCHVFRHSMATAMLQGGADVRYVQEMLGHSCLAATEVYTHVSIRQLQRVYAATHPAASLRRRAGADDDDQNDDELHTVTLDDPVTLDGMSLPEPATPERFLELTPRRRRLRETESEAALRLRAVPRHRAG